jgi:hypothetical protein
VPEYWNPCVVKVRILNIPPNEKDSHNPRFFYLPEDILWETEVQNAEFPGTSFAAVDRNYPVSYLSSFQYNETNQLAVRVSVYVYENTEAPISLDYSEIVNKRYEYFQHIIDSFRLQ